MYVCVCKAVTDKAIRQQVAAGACSMREIKQCLGVGSQCGKCVPVAQEVLAESLSRQQSALHIPCQFIQSRPAA